MSRYKIHKAEIIPNEDIEDMGYVTLLVLAEFEGQMYPDLTLVVGSFDAAYEIEKHCRTNVEPYMVEMESDHEFL